MVLLWTAISLSYVSFSQEIENEDELEDFSDDVYYAPCEGVQFEQWYALNFNQNSMLFFDLKEVPDNPFEVYDESGVLVFTSSDLHSSVTVEKYKNYSVRSMNSCNEIVEYFEVSTFPSNTKKSMVVPTKLYKFITSKLKSESEVTLWEYALESDALTASEKMHLIQEYYLDGDISNLGDDLINGIGGIEGTEGDLIEALLNDGRFGEMVKLYVFPIPDQNCMCKTVQPRSNYFHKTSGEEFALNGYKQFQSYKSYENREYKAKKRYFYWRDSTTGAAKSQRVKQYMKGSHNKTEVASFPEMLQAGTPNQTTISFTLLCESKSGEKDACMCDNRKVIIHSNYTSSVKAEANKLNCTFCGSGYSAFAQVEDLAVLTKTSLKTKMGILDAGRVLVYDRHHVSHNPQWKIELHDVIFGIVKAYYGSQSSGTFVPSLFEPLHKQIQALLNTPMHTGGGSGTSSGRAELIDYTNKAITLLPNDPTDITLHSFSRHELSGHTKWKAETWVSSSMALAGYMRYQETEECCNENQYSYIIAGQHQSDYLNKLTGVNHFLKNGGFPLNFPNKFGYQITDEHHFDNFSSSKCSPLYNSPIAPQVIPKNTPFTIKDLMTGETRHTGVTLEDIQNGSLGELVQREGDLTPGFYVLEFLINGQLYHYKTNKL